MMAEPTCPDKPSLCASSGSHLWPRLKWRGGAASRNDACVARPALGGQTAPVAESFLRFAAKMSDSNNNRQFVLFCQVSASHTQTLRSVCCSSQSLAGRGVSPFAARGETSLRRYCGRSAKVCFRLWKGAPGPWRGPGSAPGVQFVYNTSLAVWRRLSPQQHQWVSNANWSPGTFTNGSK